MNTLNSSSPPNRPNSYDIVSFTPPADEVADPTVHLQAGMSCGDLPAGFCLKDDGIYQLRATEGGETSVRICSPVSVLGLYRGSNGRGWGRVVQVRDPDGLLHQHHLDESKFGAGPDTVLRPLRDLGLMVESIDKASQSVVQLLRSWRPSRRFRRIRACGWTDDKCTAFVQANGEVIGVDQDVIPPELVNSVGAMVHKTGTLADWRENVAALCIGNPLMVHAVSHALTGPLLRPLGMEGGGFHLRGDSAKGKTTLMKTAASVWGSPSFVQTWRATDNGMEGIATACNDSLLLLDELAEVCPSKLGEIIYMLANGKGKARARQDGSAKPCAEWRLPVISSGEISAEAHMESVGKPIRAGQEVRLIDICADTRTHGAFDCLHGMASGAVFAQHLSSMAGVFHGTAGPAFVEALVRRPATFDVAGRLLEQFCSATLKHTDVVPDGKIHRVLRRFMLAAVAGEIATQLGITGWQRGTAFLAALREFRRWLQDRDAATRGEISQTIAKTRAYLDAHGHHFVPVGQFSAPDQPGWRDEQHFFIRREAWIAIHSEDAVEAARLHKAAGLLRTTDRAGLQYRMGRRVEGRPHVYAVRTEVLSLEATR